MPISFLQETYADFESFTQALRRRYETVSEPDLTPLTLTFFWPDCSPNDRKKLLQFVCDSSRQRIFRFQTDDQNETQAFQQAATYARLHMGATQQRKKARTPQLNPVKVAWIKKEPVKAPTQILHLISSASQSKAVRPERTGSRQLSPVSQPVHPNEIHVPQWQAFQSFLPRFQVVTEPQFNQLCTPHVSLSTITAFLGMTGSPHQTELVTALHSLSMPQLLPLIAQLLLVAGDTFVLAFVTQLLTLQQKEVSLKFIVNCSNSLQTFAQVESLRHLEKLAGLSADKQNWWSELIHQHLTSSSRQPVQAPVPFQDVFTYFTTVFLPKLSEMGITTLPVPCPIRFTHADMNQALVRVLTVLEAAKSQGEQTLREQFACLSGIDWGDENVLAHNPYQFIHARTAADPWLASFCKYWKDGISLTKIQHIKQIIDALSAPLWPETAKQALRLIIMQTFAATGPLTDELWQQQVDAFIQNINRLSPTDRPFILEQFKTCHQFQPSVPSLQQLNGILSTIMTVSIPIPPAREHSPNRREHPSLQSVCAILLDCYRCEGSASILQLQAQLAKHQRPPQDLLNLPTRLSHTRLRLEQTLPDALARQYFVTLLASLNHPDWQDDQIIELAHLFSPAIPDTPNTRSTIPNAKFALLAAFSQLNIARSTQLPTVAALTTFLRSEACQAHFDAAGSSTTDFWLTCLNGETALPGTLFGSARLSEPGDLVTEAIVAFFKQYARSPESIETHYQQKFQENLPDGLKTQIGPKFTNAITALKELRTTALQTPVVLATILRHLQKLETAINALLRGKYEYLLLGPTAGIDLLKAVTSGKSVDAFTRVVATKGHDLFLAAIKGQGDAGKIIQQQIKSFCETPSLVILFEDELINRRVRPQVEATLTKLEIPEPLRSKILEIISDYNKTIQCSDALTAYHKTIQDVRELLKVLVTLRNTITLATFSALIRTLATPGMQQHLSLSQQAELLRALHAANAPEETVNRLSMISQLCNDFFTQTDVDAEREQNRNSVNRAIEALPQLFSLTLDADPARNWEQQNNFLMASFKHNLTNAQPFPFVPVIKLRTLLDTLSEEQLDPTTAKEIFRLILGILQNAQLNIQKLTPLIDKICQMLSEPRPPEAREFEPESTGKLITRLLRQINSKQMNEELDKTIELLTACSTTAETPALDATQQDQLRRVLTCVAQTEDSALSLTKLTDLKASLVDDPRKLGPIHSLFRSRPYPSIEMLDEALNLRLLADLTAYCHAFDLNPFLKPGEHRPVEEHFSLVRAAPVINGITRLTLQQPIPLELRKKLAQQVTKINLFGRTTCQTLSREALQQRTTRLLLEHRADSASFKRTPLKMLHLIAYLRESFYRTTCSVDSKGNKTGLFANSTQLLTLLLSFHYPLNLLKQINTGEGKSLLTPLLATLLWAEGETVDVCTANSDLLERDFAETCVPLFRFLNIPCSLIRANTTPRAYRVGGINCSTLKQRGIFEMVAEYNRTPLAEGKKSLILDEADQSLYEETTLLAIGKHREQHAQHHPLTWLFLSIDDFVKQSDFKQIGETAWSSEQDIEKLRAHLYQKFSGNPPPFPSDDNELLKYLNAAIRAQQLELEQDFILQPQKQTDGGVDIVTHFKVIPTQESSGIFADGVHPALLARLQHEHPAQVDLYPIPCDPTIVAYQSVQHLIRKYQASQGRILGISGTLGMTQELRYLASLFEMEAIAVPSHAENRRKEHDAVYTLSPKEKTNAVIATVRNIRQDFIHNITLYNPADSMARHRERFAQSQPPSILIITKDVKEARTYYNALQSWYKQHFPPLCFMVEDPTQLASFQARCDAARGHLGLTATRNVKIISATAKPRILEQLRQQGYSVHSVKGDDPVDNIQERLGQATYRLQFINGTETPEDLNKKIKQAADPNTLTIGPQERLGRGIDVKNTYQHRYGTCVIPTSIEASKRMKDQLKGRSGRNGDVGNVWPHYQITPPSVWWEKILYFVSSRYRRSFAARQQLDIERRLERTAAVERIYTKRVDEVVQQCLMAQFNAWSHLFLEENPNPQLAYELDDYRSELLTEVRNHIETNPTEATLDEQLARFDNALDVLWDRFKETKLIPKAKSLPLQTAKQEIGFSYLETISLRQALLVQERSSTIPTFQEVMDGESEQTLEMILANEARAELEYPEAPLTAVQEAELRLKEAQTILPYLLNEILEKLPHTAPRINELLTIDTAETATPLFTTIVTTVESWFTRLNKVLSRIFAYIQSFFSDKLAEESLQTQQIQRARLKKIQDKIVALPSTRLEQLIQFIQVSLMEEVKNQSTSLVNQFRLQTPILVFDKLKEASAWHRNSVPDYDQIVQNFKRHLMQQIATMIIQQLSWVSEEPCSYMERSIDVNLEPEEVIVAATTAYQAATKLLRETQDDSNEAANQSFYATLQKQAHLLKRLTIFAVGHTNPLKVIQTALDAIGVLTRAPVGCERPNRQEIHDRTLIQVQLDSFKTCLQEQTKNRKRDPRWDFFVRTLTPFTDNPTYGSLLGLQACVARFQTYDSYKEVFSSSLTVLQNQMTRSLSALNKPGKLYAPNRFSIEFLAQQKRALTISSGLEEVEVKTGFDGLREYIDVQIKPTGSLLSKAPKGYVSSPRTQNCMTSQATQLTRDWEKFEATQRDFDANTEPLDEAHLSRLPLILHAQFKKLLTLQTHLTRLCQKELWTDSTRPLLQNWPQEFSTSLPVATDLHTLQQTKWNDAILLANRLFEINAETLNRRAVLYDKIQQLECKLQQEVANNPQPEARGPLALIQRVKQLVDDAPAAAPEINTSGELTSTRGMLHELNQSLKRQAMECFNRSYEELKTELTVAFQAAKTDFMTQYRQHLITKQSEIEKYRTQETQRARTAGIRFFNPADYFNFTAEIQNEGTQVPTLHSREKDKLTQLLNIFGLSLAHSQRRG